MDNLINEQLNALESLLRDADDKLAGSYHMTTLQRKRLRRQRNAINAACNAMFRAKRA